ncbi:hypothetical protein ACQPXH_15885 [Nocardia sp. CA-135953]|uniref:hypothetical protein n=1 Tax=Nocardia sp. CA-135953 TaxID=3239978 RepID=UPI003D958536
MTRTEVPPATDRYIRWQAYALIAGGVLFAVGNGLHPLEHSEAAEQASTWAAAHLTFTVGAVLLAVGLGVVTSGWTGADHRASTTDRRVSEGVGSGATAPPPTRGAIAKVATAAGVLLYLGLTLAIPIGAYHEIYVAPQLSHHEQHRIEDAALPVTGPLAAAFLLGALLIAVCALLAPRPRMGRASGALIVLAVLAMAGAEGLPGAQGLWVIPGTIVMGLVLAAAGVRALRD